MGWICIVVLDGVAIGICIFSGPRVPQIHMGVSAIMVGTTPSQQN